MEKIMRKVWKSWLIVLAVLTLFGLVVLFFRLSLGGFHGLPPNPGHGMMPAGKALGWETAIRFSIPVFLVSLLVLFGIWIGRISKPTTIIQNITQAVPAPQPEPTCGGCGKDMDDEWIVCPYCGTHR